MEAIEIARVRDGLPALSNFFGCARAGAVHCPRFLVQRCS
jgi:hypothetical protein